MGFFKPDAPQYKFNKRTLKYEKVEYTLWYRIRGVLRFIFTSALLGFGFFLFFIFILPSPSAKKLQKENEEISTQYEILSKKLDHALEVMDIIQERDNNFYRVMLEADSIPYVLRTGNYDATARYDKWDDYKTASLVKSTSKKMDKLNRMLYTQSNSFDELIVLAKQNEDKLLHIPAIQPILNQDLKRTASGYGRRIDPIYKTIRFHKGMDFSAPTGTEIFATADGVIEKISWDKTGYGNCVIIDHGYGYKTLYAHCHKFQKGLRKGLKVKRGDVIAFVGNTGKSTGPHLHYEVRYKNKPQNPQNYYFQDLSPEEYDNMVRISSNSSKTFD
jgi:murein DD-endopeptidase MepM/ murein hydrolase activator NlpD